MENNINNVIFPNNSNIYLQAYLEYFRPWLDSNSVTEILVNKAGEIWIEQAGKAKMECHKRPEIDDQLLKRLATQIARSSFQGINRERPILSASLPNGDRVQIIGPPATRHGWCMAIRRHRITTLTLDDFKLIPPAVKSRNPEWDQKEPPVDFLRRAISDKKTILISGGTSSGKTTFLSTMLREIPASERIILVEDTAEINLQHENSVGLIAVKGEMGQALIDTDDLLQASLRLRPDRIILGEIRGREAVSFLRAVNTGHPGSFSTIHASSPRGALEQLALMSLQAGIGLRRQDVFEYAATVIDLIVQLDRSSGQRGISEILTTHQILNR